MAHGEGHVHNASWHRLRRHVRGPTLGEFAFDRGALLVEKCLKFHSLLLRQGGVFVHEVLDYAQQARVGENVPNRVKY